MANGIGTVVGLALSLATGRTWCALRRGKSKIYTVWNPRTIMLMQLPDEWLNQEFLGDAEKPFLYPTDQIFQDDEKIDT